MIITSNEYEFFVAGLFVKRNEGADGLMHAAAGIAGEAGEILDAVKKHWVYGQPLDRENLIEEIGDTLFYLQALASLIDSTFGEAVAHNVEKLRKRYPNGYSDKAAQERADKC